MRRGGALLRRATLLRTPLRSIAPSLRCGSVTRRWFWGASQDAPVVCKQFQDVRTSYQLGPELGAGAYATVYEGVESATGQQHALKAIEKIHVDAPTLKGEIDILMKVAGCDECMDLHHVFEDARFVWLASTMYRGGELFDAIVAHCERGETYTEQHAAVMIAQVIRAVGHCHDVGVIHRDVKPENILLKNPDTGSGSLDDLDVVLVDFGIS